MQLNRTVLGVVGLILLVFVIIILLWFSLSYKIAHQDDPSAKHTDKSHTQGQTKQQTEPSVKVDWDSSRITYASSSSKTKSLIPENSGDKYIKLFYDSVELTKENNFSFQKRTEYQSLVYLIKSSQTDEPIAEDYMRDLYASLSHIDNWYLFVDLTMRYMICLLGNELPQYLRKKHLEDIKVYFILLQVHCKKTNPHNLDNSEKEKLNAAINFIYNTSVSMVLRNSQ